MQNEKSQSFPGITRTNTGKKNKSLFFVALAGTSAGREKEKATDILAKQKRKRGSKEKVRLSY